jgi:hypothetical protein
MAGRFNLRPIKNKNPRPLLRDGVFGSSIDIPLDRVAKKNLMTGFNFQTIPIIRESVGVLFHRLKHFMRRKSREEHSPFPA